MKFQLDTKEKTIKVEESVNLGRFIEAFAKLFPDGEWKEYTLETNSQIVWSNPVVINPYKQQYPYWEYIPIVTYDSSSPTMNFEIKY